MGLCSGLARTPKVAPLDWPPKAKEFFLTDEIISAEEAKEIGLVWKFVPSGKLDAAVEEWRVKFNKLRGISLATIKQQFGSVMKTDWKTMVELDGSLGKDLLGGLEALPRLKSFRDR